MVGCLRNLIFIWSATISAQAFAGTMIAEIDRAQSSLDEPFTMTVNVQGSLDGDVVEPESKEFEITRTGESTNISIINGQMTKERQYSYQVRALKEGRLTIPSLKARVDGEDLHTAPIQVDVKGGVAEPSRDEAASNARIIFVERDLPKKTMYQGEAIISKVRLLTRARLTGATPTRDAAPDWRLIGSEGQKNMDVVRDGVRWSVIEMNEGLIPLKTGKIKAPSFGINATWVQPVARKRGPRNIFEMFQNGNFNMGEEVSRKLLSDVIEVVVKPLPSPKPAEFADVVGAFTLSTNVSKRAIGAGETATVTVEIKGQGALDHMKDFKLNIAGARVYTDKPTLTEKIEAGAGLISSKTFKFAVVPNAQGTVELGTLKIASFNSFTETYDTMTASLGSLVVGVSPLGGSANNVVAPSQPLAESPKTVTAEQAVVKSDASPGQAVGADGTTGAALASRKVTDQPENIRPWFFGPVALAIEVLLLAAIVGGLIVRRGWRRLRMSAPTSKRKSAKQWQGLIGELIGELASGDRPVFDRAVIQLKEILSENSQDPLAMTSQDLIKSAESMNFEPKHVEALRRLLNELDRMAYSGGTDSATEPSVIADLRDLLVYCQSRSV
jgi:BatD DUF11 like domain